MPRCQGKPLTQGRGSTDSQIAHRNGLVDGDYRGPAELHAEFCRTDQQGIPDPLIRRAKKSLLIGKRNCRPLARCNRMLGSTVYLTPCFVLTENHGVRNIVLSSSKLLILAEDG